MYLSLYTQWIPELFTGIKKGKVTGMGILRRILKTCEVWGFLSPLMYLNTCMIYFVLNKCMCIYTTRSANASYLHEKIQIMFTWPKLH